MVYLRKAVNDMEICSDCGDDCLIAKQRRRIAQLEKLNESYGLRCTELDEALTEAQKRIAELEELNNTTLDALTSAAITIADLEEEKARQA